MSVKQTARNSVKFIDLCDRESEIVSGGYYQSTKFSKGNDTVLQVFAPGRVESTLGKNSNYFRQDSGSILIVEF